jgi:DNA-binding NarL/FixJ family response regulator
MKSNRKAAGARSPRARKNKTAETPAPRASPSKRVFIVDDHPLMRESMARLINGEPDLICCGGANSAEQAVSEITKTKPDAVITDITLPNRSGLELIKDLSAMHPHVCVLVYSMHDEMFYAERALRAGARGYLMKEAGSEKMLEALRSVLAGEVAVSGKIASKILNLFSGPNPRRSNSPVEKLTDREFDIYQLIGKGRSTKEIAEQLHISPKTVAVHREHIKEKLGVESASELMHHAIRWEEAQGVARPSP